MKHKCLEGGAPLNSADPSIRGAMRLPESQVDVWCASLPEEWDVRLAHAYRGLLSAEEAKRASRFVFEHDRRQFLLTRALVRDVLSRYVGLEPFALAFTHNEYGKPALEEPVDCPVRFSLSHTKGLSVLAVTSAHPIGVDVESLQRPTCHQELARRFFATPEVVYLDNLNDNEQRSEFIRLWTLKEAFVKGLGKGLAIPLNSFAIHLAHDSPPRLSLPGSTSCKPPGWQFLQISLKDAFHISVAVLIPVDDQIAVRFRKTTPLKGMTTPFHLQHNSVNQWILDAV